MHSAPYSAPSGAAYIASYRAPSRYEHQVLWLKRWIWIYFWLLIFEGALRKWAFPSLSGPLLLIRDPVVMILYVQAYRCGKFSMTRMWPIAFFAVGMIMLAGVQILADVNTVPIALYGLRSYVLHVPLILIMADTLDEEDLHRFGRWILLLSLPMTALVLAQFRAGGDSWLNKGAGEDSGQILSAGGHIRPAGTFSYGIGAQLLTVIVTAFLLDALMRKGRYPRWLVWSSLAVTMFSIPALGSRTVLLTMAGLGAFTVFSGMSHAGRLVNVVKIVAVLLVVGFLSIQIPFFNHAVDTMKERWAQGERAEGDIGEVIGSRVFGAFENGLESTGTTPWLGRGIGMGSNFAAVSKTGSQIFLLGESEWERVVPEFGPILGLLFMGARFGFGGYIVIQAYRALKRNAPLAWLLVPAVVPVLVMSIMEQPTYLGFMVFGAGICLAAARINSPSMDDRYFGVA